MGNIYEELLAAQGRARRYSSTGGDGGRTELQRDVETVMAKIERSVKDFENRDRKSLLRAAAGPVRNEARRYIRGNKLGKRKTLVYERQKPRRRMKKRTGKPSNNKEVKNIGARKGRISSSYVPGNLWRSVRTLTFRGSPDVFVGAKFGGGGINAGTSFTNADGWYFDFAFGGRRGAFKRAVLDPAAIRARKEVISSMREKAVKRLKDRAKRRGLDVG